MSRTKTQKIAFAALFGAMTFVATWVSFPTPIGGNVNLGDCVLLLAAWMPLEPWSILSCAVGATLTDLAAGYAVYAPATFVIKALMVAVAVLIKRGTPQMLRPWRAILSGLAAEAVMVMGYCAYEALALYGVAAFANVPFNLVQGGVSLVAATALAAALSRMPLPGVLRSKNSLFEKGFTKKQ